MAGFNKPKGLYSFFIAVVFFYYMYAIWKAINSDNLANGNKYVLVTLALIMGTIYWQSKRIEKLTQRSFKEILYAEDVGKPKKWALIFSILVGVAVFVSMLSAQLIVWFFDGGWLHDAAIANTLKYTGFVLDDEIPETIWLIIGLIFLFVFSTIIAASVFMTLFMGATFTCLSAIIALHNWFNGGGFDIGILVEALFNLTLNNTLSYLVVIGHFIISQIISSGGSS